MENHVMAYAGTTVAVGKSQESLRKIIMSNKGAGVAFISQPPSEGFEAMIVIDGKTYRIRVMAKCRVKDGRGYVYSEKQKEQEQRRVWRVLFYHMKSVYEATSSGVMEFRELMLPYIVTGDNRTVAEHIIPKLEQCVTSPSRMLTD
jgi:hypothetical protein